MVTIDADCLRGAPQKAGLDAVDELSHLGRVVIRNCKALRNDAVACGERRGSQLLSS